MSLIVESVNNSQSEILNGNSDITVKDLLSSDNKKILKSEDDEQLIINIRFSEQVKISSIQFIAPDESGPATVKLFVNNQTIDFNNVESEKPTQVITFKSSDELKSDSKPVNLIPSKFQKVTSLTIFVEDNLSGDDVTKIQNILLHGKGLADKVDLTSGNGSNVKKLTSELEYNKYKAEKDKLVVVDFSAVWCPPCKLIEPVFDELSMAFPEVTFIKLDIDQCKSFADAKDVHGVPTFKFFKNNVLLTSFSGANKALLTENIKKYK